MAFKKGFSLVQVLTFISYQRIHFQTDLWKVSKEFLKVLNQTSFTKEYQVVIFLIYKSFPKFTSMFLYFYLVKIPPRYFCLDNVSTSWYTYTWWTLILVIASIMLILHDLVIPHDSVIYHDLVILHDMLYTLKHS